MAGERHDGAALVGTFGGAMQVVDGVLSGGQMGGVWQSNGLAMAFFHRVFEGGASGGSVLEGGARGVTRSSRVVQR